MEQSHTRIMAFLHISGMGQLDQEIGELQDIRWARVEKAVEAAKMHADRIVGIKVRLTDNIVGDNDMVAITRAVEAANELGKPLMIHIGGSAHPLEDLFPKLRPGDIVTHSFTGNTNGILDNTGKVKDVAWDAARRGVIFDVGHGAGSFSFDVQEKAIADDFWPGTVSSDVHRYNLRGPVFDLMTTLSKYLYLGLNLDQVIELGTTKPARAVHLDEHIGTLQVGADADISIIELREGPVTLTDARGATRQGNQLLLPVETLRAGRRFSPQHSFHPHLIGHGHSH
jgi:dihydroorotase